MGLLGPTGAEIFAGALHENASLRRVAARCNALGAGGVTRLIAVAESKDPRKGGRDSAGSAVESSAAGLELTLERLDLRDNDVVFAGVPSRAASSELHGGAESIQERVDRCATDILL